MVIWVAKSTAGSKHAMEWITRLTAVVQTRVWNLLCFGRDVFAPRVGRVPAGVQGLASRVKVVIFD